MWSALSIIYRNMWIAVRRLGSGSAPAKLPWVIEETVTILLKMPDADRRFKIPE